MVVPANVQELLNVVTDARTIAKSAMVKYSMEIVSKNVEE